MPFKFNTTMSYPTLITLVTLIMAGIVALMKFGIPASATDVNALGNRLSQIESADRIDRTIVTGNVRRLTLLEQFVAVDQQTNEAIKDNQRAMRKDFKEFAVEQRAVNRNVQNDVKLILRALQRR